MRSSARVRKGCCHRCCQTKKKADPKTETSRCQVQKLEATTGFEPVMGVLQPE